MNKRALRAASILSIVLTLLSARLSVGAVSPDEETRRLLEKSLSIVEIDKEIGRIREQHEALADTAERTAERLAEREAAVERKREEAGRVLRSYYMGEKDMLLAALLHFDSLADLLAMLDYVQLLFARDQHTLNDYMAQYRELKQNYEEQNRELELLKATEDELLKQRNRLAALQAELDSELDGRTDAERLRIWMDEMNRYWETAGLREVRQYFRALADAMQQLPDWVQSNDDYLTIQGLQYTLVIPEDGLNAFLREQNDLFMNFSFGFQDGRITAGGSREGMDVQIAGHYTVEDEPKNGLVFHVDELRFNGLYLPDTTRRALEKEFDLGFYPHKIMSFLKATSVSISDGELKVTLNVGL
ncbi:hypothetical protein ABEV74_16725 [Paenibacillus cisolokensis]|uniref:coiled-coil domain-containing protein n=1 Tax=Paenibacillus cisolokensis TaxID=1658519 RepID=UPI003D2D92A1